MAISVGTATLCLAVALAYPVWVLLPCAPDWRWLVQREDTPWYPSMRRFRQSTLGDWAGVLKTSSGGTQPGGAPVAHLHRESGAVTSLVNQGRTGFAPAQLPRHANHPALSEYHQKLQNNGLLTPSSKPDSLMAAMNHTEKYE